MTQSGTPNFSNLNDCGCCEGLETQTPREIDNRSGLEAIDYRVGTHSQFKQSLLVRLSDPKLLKLQLLKLQELRTREDDDFAIALLDAWATVADVLTFYQERIANEAYLRTARERVSLLYLARLIGYELRPGVAANTYLAFTLEDTPTAPRQVTLDIGTKVQSVPGPGEKPQTYETVDKLEARAEWNAIKPRLSQCHPVTKETDTFWFKGIVTGLQPGDSLLIVPEDSSEAIFRQIDQVTPQAEHQRTKVKLQPLPPEKTASLNQPQISLKNQSLLASQIAQPFLNQSIKEADLQAIARMRGFSVQSLFKNVVATQASSPKVLAFRTKAAIFGHNAPKWENLPYVQREGELVYEKVPVTPSTTPPRLEIKKDVEDGIYKDRKDSWADTTLENYHDEPADSTNIYLDSVYPKIVKNSWVVLKDDITNKDDEGSLTNKTNKWKAYQVAEVTELTKSDFTLTAKITRLSLTNKDDFDQFNIRSTTVFAQSEELELAPLPIKTEVSDKEIKLNGSIENLFKGQLILIEGELNQNRGNYNCEAAIIDDVKHYFGRDSYTTIILKDSLTHKYVRNTVTIYGNIARATHGESKEEVIGSGDASQPYQQFTLSHAPLTYTSSSNPSGAESTLEVRVNGILWHEVPRLYGKGADDRVFVTRLDDEGKTTLQFGDGKTGTRLPTGQENLKASYRQGIGLAGQVKAKQLTLLMSRPLGLKSVTNPLPATGAQDRESRDEARRNAPLTVLTLDRIVSLQDYEDFARAFSGIAKAIATWIWNGQKRSILVTIAGYQGEPITEDSETYKKLLAAMTKAGDPSASFSVKSYQPKIFHLDAGIKVDPDYLTETVLAQVRQSLLSHFSFESRDLGQPVTKSEAIALMQSVPGVIAVDLNLLYIVGEAQLLKERLNAYIPQVGTRNGVGAAELLMLTDEQLKLTAIA